MCLFDCLVFVIPVYIFFTHMETSPLPMKDETFELRSALMGIEHWVFSRMPPTVKRDIRLKWSYPSTRDTHTYCPGFGSWTVTTCLSDLRLSRLGFEHPTFRMRGELSNRLRYRRGFNIVKSLLNWGGQRELYWFSGLYFCV